MVKFLRECGGEEKSQQITQAHKFDATACRNLLTDFIPLV